MTEWIRQHPVIAGILAVAAIAGAVVGLLYLDPTWSAGRRIAAGGLAGGGIGFLMTATRML